MSVMTGGCAQCGQVDRGQIIEGLRSLSSGQRYKAFKAESNCPGTGDKNLNLGTIV